MSQTNFYDLSCRYYGQNVRITCRDGRVHRGEITRVTKNMVWIRPTDGLGGYGLGFGGFGFGIALGTITGIALASAFFW